MNLIDLIGLLVLLSRRSAFVANSYFHVTSITRRQVPPSRLGVQDSNSISHLPNNHLFMTRPSVGDLVIAEVDDIINTVDEPVVALKVWNFNVILVISCSYIICPSG
jgi:hypothetical protein